MKKIIYSISMATALLFTACSEHKGNRGTTYEVADANNDEPVNPAQIRQYPLPGTAGYATTSADENTTGSNLTATQLVIAYYDSVNPVRAYRSQNYKFSSTKLMGGKAAAESTATKTSNNNKNMDSGTTRTPGSTTAEGQSRDAVGNQKTGNDKIRVTDSKKKPVDTGNKTKKRLTPDQ